MFKMFGKYIKKNKMDCKFCLNTRIMGTIDGFEPCRACMRNIGYDVDKDPKGYYTIK